MHLLYSLLQNLFSQTASPILGHTALEGTLGVSTDGTKNASGTQKSFGQLYALGRSPECLSIIDFKSWLFHTL